MNQDNYSTPVKSSSFIPNSTQIPNDYVDKFMAFLTPDEWKILTYAVRRIFGFQRRQDHISLAQFSEGISRRDGTRLDYGTGLSLRMVRQAVRGLVTAGLLIQLAAPKADRTPALYALQLDPEQVDITFLQRRKDATNVKNTSRISKAGEKRKGKKSKSERVTATNGVRHTSPVRVSSHVTPTGDVTRHIQQSVKQYPGENNYAALMSFFASLEEEDQKHLESLKALSLREELKKQHAEYFINQIHSYGQAKVFGYLTWCANEGHSWAKAYNVDKKRHLIEEWQIEPEPKTREQRDHERQLKEAQRQLYGPKSTAESAEPSPEQLARELKEGERERQAREERVQKERAQKTWEEQERQEALSKRMDDMREDLQQFQLQGELKAGAISLFLMIKKKYGQDALYELLQEHAKIGSTWNDAVKAGFSISRQEPDNNGG